MIGSVTGRSVSAVGNVSSSRLTNCVDGRYDIWSPITSSAPSFGSPVGDAAIAVGGLPTIRTFVLPYKRFATPCLISRAQDYLDKADVTYRQTVRHDRSLIGYPIASDEAASEGDQLPHQPVVDHSLIWRMVGWLGGLTWALDQARDMILQRNPDSTCHRIDGSVDPRKAILTDRLTTLETARQLLHVIPEWEGCFGCKFFPKFATRSGFG